MTSLHRLDYVPEDAPLVQGRFIRPFQPEPNRFMLDVLVDPHARVALAAYADSCEEADPTYAAYLRDQLQDPDPSTPGHVAGDMPN